MNLDELAAKYNLQSNVRGIFHGGAHLAEEAPDYDRVFPNVPVWWVEANSAVLPKIAAALSTYPKQTIFQALLCDTDGEDRIFNVTNYDGMSSSIFRFGTHPEFSPDTVFERQVIERTTTIDTLIACFGMDVNMLVLDIQGAEGLALAGAKELLPKLDFVMLEVNNAEVYKGCAKVWDLDDTLLAVGLKRAETYWVGEQGWGDACWVR